MKYHLIVTALKEELLLQVWNKKDNLFLINFLYCADEITRPAPAFKIRGLNQQ